jgi:16S rRNA (uracil1498-N3)-methyltransferase
MAKRRQQSSNQQQRSVSNTYRFFVASEMIKERSVLINDSALTHQLSNVLRLGEGDTITLLDNSGWEYRVVLESVSRGEAHGVVTGKTLGRSEPQVKLALYVALLRGERFEWVLQKGTELGITTFVPVVCERSVVDDIASIGVTKLERWQRIIREAAEQSTRAKLPKLQPAMLFALACDHAARRSHAFLLWEGDGAATLRALLRQSGADFGAETGAHPPLSIALFSGPEGGFTPSEITTARNYGIKLATLGPRILRAETAPLAAASAVFFACGDLG